MFKRSRFIFYRRRKFQLSVLAVLLFMSIYFLSHDESVIDIVNEKLNYYGLHSNDWHLFISSVYYVEDADTAISKNVIRLNVLTENNAKVRYGLLCEIDGKLVKPSVYGVYGIPESCSWSSFFIDCPVEEQPNQFALVDKIGNTHELSIIETDKTQRTFVVCFPRLFHFESWVILLTSLELYELYGAELINIQLMSVIDEIYTILRAYEDAGKVRLKPAPKIPKFKDIDFEFDANSQSPWFNQVTSYTECLYDFRSSTEFILNVDVDDILIPRNYSDLKEQFIWLKSQNPLASSFEFMWGPTHTFANQDPEKFTISELMSESNTIGFAKFGKSVLLPKRVDVGLIHNQLPKVGYGHVQLTSEDTGAFHFRQIYHDKGKNKRMGVNFFVNDTKKYLGLDEKLRIFLGDNLEAKKAYKNLPTQRSYEKIFYKCYVELAKHVNKWSNCPGPLQCKVKKKDMKHLPPCVVLENKYQHTKMNSGLKIASVIKSEFVHRKNCFV